MKSDVWDCGNQSNRSFRKKVWRKRKVSGKSWHPHEGKKKLIETGRTDETKEDCWKVAKGLPRTKSSTSYQQTVMFPWWWIHSIVNQSQNKRGEGKKKWHNTAEEKKRISKFENWAKNIRQTKMGKKRDRKNERDASGVFLNGFHGWPKMRPLSRVFSFFFYQCVCVLMCVCVCFFCFFFWIFLFWRVRVEVKVDSWCCGGSCFNGRLFALSFDVLGPRISLITILYLLLAFSSFLWPIRFFLMKINKKQIK